MGMFELLKQWRDRHNSDDVSDAKSDGEIDETLALAILMIAAAKADGVFDPAEQDAVKKILSEELGLNNAQAEETLATAKRLEEEAIEFYTFVRKVSKGHPYGERLKVLKLLFRVIVADGESAFEEEEKLGRIARALEISTVDFGKMKAAMRKSL